MRNLWSWGPGDDRLAVPRSIRAGFSVLFVAWLLVEVILRVGHPSPGDIVLSLATSVSVIATIGLGWFIPTRRGPRDNWSRLAVVVVVATLGIISLFLQGVNSPGQVATFAAVIMASNVAT